MRAAVLAAILLMSTLVAVAPDPVTADDPALVLKVGAPDEMRTRNPLPATANEPAPAATPTTSMLPAKA